MIKGETFYNLLNDGLTVSGMVSRSSKITELIMHLALKTISKPRSASMLMVRRGDSGFTGLTVSALGNDL